MTDRCFFWSGHFRVLSETGNETLIQKGNPERDLLESPDLFRSLCGLCLAHFEIESEEPQTNRKIKGLFHAKEDGRSVEPSLVCKHKKPSASWRPGRCRSQSIKCASWSPFWCSLSLASRAGEEVGEEVGEAGSRFRPEGLS